MEIIGPDLGLTKAGRKFSMVAAQLQDPLKNPGTPPHRLRK